MTNFDDYAEQDNETTPLEHGDRAHTLQENRVTELSGDQKQTIWDRTDRQHPILVEWRANRTPGRQWMLQTDSLTIGRKDTASDLAIPFDEISRQHVHIYRNGDAYWVEDLDSKNGTWLNGNQLTKPQRLWDGDEINIALCIRLIFLSEDAVRPMVTVGDTHADPR